MHWQIGIQIVPTAYTSYVGPHAYDSWVTQLVAPVLHCVNLKTPLLGNSGFLMSRITSHGKCSCQTAEREKFSKDRVHKGARGGKIYFHFGEL